MPTDSAAPEPSIDVDAERRGDRRGLLAVVAVLLAIYAGVHNGYWTPGGDSEVYAAVARSLARGEWLTYNGQSVAIVTPGWPFVLAGLMQVSASFAFLKACQAAILIAAFAVAYRILRRYASPRLAAVCTVLAGSLHLVYPLSFWLHSDPLLLLLGNLAVLGALRVGEQRGGVQVRLATAAIVMLLASLCVLVHYRGVFQWLLIAGAFFAGRARTEERATPLGAWLRPLAANAAAITLTGGIVAATFLATKHSLGLSRERARPEPAPGVLLAEADTTPLPTTRAATNAPDDTPRGHAAADVLPPDPRGVDHPAAGRPEPATQDNVSTPNAVDFDEEDIDASQMVNQEALGHGDPFAAPGGRRGRVAEYAARVASGGKWMSWLLWYPSRFADSVRPIDLIPAVVGWVAIALLAVAAWRFARRGHGLWIGATLFLATIVTIWPNPNARYLIPLAPLAILGTIHGLRALLPRRAALAMAGVFVASVAAANALLYAVDLRVARAGDDYAALWEGGDWQQLVAAVEPLRELAVRDGEVAVSERYQNLGRVRFSPSGPRAVQLLLDRDLTPVPKNVSNAPWVPSVADWCAEHGVRYYLYQETVEPWRLWHFRLPDSLHERLAGKPPRPAAQGVGGGWQLYRLDRGNDGGNVLVPVAPDPDAEWPRRMPGLD